MRPVARRRGSGLVELLVGTVLCALIVSALGSAFAAAARVLTTGAARGELEDIAHIAVESFTFDVRRAGYAPTGPAVTPLAEAFTDRVTLTADLDADGAVSPTSEETIAYVCNLAAHRLSRIVGRQSLPVADGVTSCALRYLDAAGGALAVPAAGLSMADMARVRALAIDLTIAAPGLGMPTARTVLVGLRVAP